MMKKVEISNFSEIKIKDHGEHLVLFQESDVLLINKSDVPKLIEALKNQEAI